MFPNNPLFVDKMVQSRQEDIERGLPDPSTYELRNSARFPVKIRVRARFLAPVGVLLVLAWGLHALL